jgi:hypothetical protein
MKYWIWGISICIITIIVYIIAGMCIFKKQDAFVLSHKEYTALKVSSTLLKFTDYEKILQNYKTRIDNGDESAKDERKQYLIRSDEGLYSELGSNGISKEEAESFFQKLNRHMINEICRDIDIGNYNPNLNIFRSRRIPIWYNDSDLLNRMQQISIIHKFYPMY